jgi:16S rRNA (guanine966-N2)-methyltransferase
VRVIAGEAKGVRLATVPAGTRPVSDRAREGLFSSLAGRVADAVVLDLYAGTGALGIEALSRGAARAVFVDEGEAAIRTIRENLARTGLTGRGEVRRGSVERHLRRPGHGDVDLVLADPPYAIPPADLRTLLQLLRGHLARDAMIVLTRPRRDHTDVIPVDLEAAKTLTYGDTLVHLIREDLRARQRGVPGDL